MIRRMGPRLFTTALCAFVLLAGAMRVAAADSRWVTPRPPYPAAARQKHESGKMIFRVATDATGRVVKASAAVPANQKNDLPELSKGCVNWILAHWHGPPNAKGKMEVEFVLR